MKGITSRGWRSLSYFPWLLPLKSSRQGFGLFTWCNWYLSHSMINTMKHGIEWKRYVMCSHGNWPPSLEGKAPWWRPAWGLYSADKEWDCAALSDTAEHQAEPSVLPLLPFLSVHGMFWAAHRYHQYRGDTSWWIKLTAVAVIQRTYLIL